MDAPNRYPLPPILTAGTVVLALLLQWLVPIAWRAATFWAVLGALVALAAVALMAWAIVTMRRHQANVMPHRAATALVTDGPFSWSRNPIYLADILLVLGLAFLFGNAWMLLGALVLALLLRELAVKREEAHLRARFPAPWGHYAERTGRWL